MNKEDNIDNVYNDDDGHNRRYKDNTKLNDIEPLDWDDM